MWTPEEIRSIVEMADPVRRNRRISETYHALAVALADRSADLTWCAFATWASASAGRIIAEQELPSAFRALLAESEEYHHARSRLVRHLEHATVLHAADTVSNRVSAAVAAGNALVFGDVAPMFAALADGRPAPGDLPAPLRDAYARYERAFAEPDPVARAHGILGANVAAVRYEQERLQPHIAEAMNAGLRVPLHALTGNRFLRREARRLVETFESVLHAAEEVWDRALTRYATTLVTPERSFDLGDDVPPLADGRRGPAVLRTLTAPDPADLVALFDRTNGTLVGSGARNWVRLDDRMNYIVNLFRSRQRQAVLLQPLA